MRVKLIECVCPPAESATDTVRFWGPAGVPGIVVCAEELQPERPINPPPTSNNIMLNRIHRRSDFQIRFGQNVSPSKPASANPSSGPAVFLIIDVVGALVEIVSVEVITLPPGVTEAGLKVQVALLGSEPQEKLIVPL